MDLDRWEHERGARWDELEELVARAGTSPERLGPAGVLRLGGLYRSALADLAFLRRRGPSQPVALRLEALVARARQAVYADTRVRAGSLGTFVSRGFWRRVAERPRPVAVAAGLLMLGVLLGVLWGLGDPGGARGLVPGAFIDGAAPPRGDRGLDAGQAAAFSSSIFTNNIQVAGVCFAVGIAGCVGAALALLYNGAILGVVVGIAFASGGGDGPQVLRLVVAHGVLELSCIVVAAAAGLRIGWALIRPGSLTRGAALAREAQRSVGIVAGVAAWLVVAGLVEGFFSPAGHGALAAVTLGVALGAAFWGLVLWRGRAPHSTARRLTAR